ncbi:MAG: methyltransferase domain-containing protein [Deltaproteobacteria bacterium]|nr:methyltransferase domain-containing protein [Deltaproteobacteria bacterium]
MSYHSQPLEEVSGPALRPGGLGLTARAWDLAGLAPGARVLDLGAGLGETVAWLTRERGALAVGVDASPELLARARARYPGARLVAGRAEALPLAPGSWDAVFVECVLSLVPQPEMALTEVKRLLKPGGRLVLTDLYLRGAAPGGNLASLAPASCLAGARSRGAVEALVAGAGFRLLGWEDHSRDLRELAAQLVWAHGSAEALFRRWGGGEAACRGGGLTQGAKPGYFLLIAGTEEASHG